MTERKLYDQDRYRKRVLERKAIKERIEYLELKGKFQGYSALETKELKELKGKLENKGLDLVDFMPPNSTYSEIWEEIHKLKATPNIPKTKPGPNALTVVFNPITGEFETVRVKEKSKHWLRVINNY